MSKDTVLETASDVVAKYIFNLLRTAKFYKWAAIWQNQQSDCAPSEDSDHSLRCALNG